MDEKRLDYLLKLNADLRDEVKQRIKQRDTFATALIVACGTIIGVSFGEFEYASFLIWLMPIVAIFFSRLILYSYKIHDRITDFLREKVEPELSKLLAIENPADLCWETHCKSKQPDKDTAGIRRKFFSVVIFIIPIIAAVINFLLCYFRTDEAGDPVYSLTVVLCTTIIGLFVTEFIAWLVYLKVKKADKGEGTNNNDSKNQNA